MATANTKGSGAVARREAAFLALVEAQDRGLSVRESRRAVGETFGLTEDEVLAIEDEGVENGWLPV